MMAYSGGCYVYVLLFKLFIYISYGTLFFRKYLYYCCPYRVAYCFGPLSILDLLASVTRSSLRLISCLKISPIP